MASTLYRQLIGSLMYLVNARSDICFVVNTLSQFIVERRWVHWVAMKHVLRYLCGIVQYELRYVKFNRMELRGYIVSN